MKAKRVLAFLILVVLLSTSLNTSDSIAPFATGTGTMSHALADDESSAASDSPIVEPTLTVASSTATPDISATDTVGPTPSPDTTIAPEATDEVTVTPDSTVSIAPSASPTMAPALFSPDTLYGVQVSGSSDAAGTVLTVQLETLVSPGSWVPVPDPTQPEIIDQLSLTLNARGDAYGEFSLEGMSSTGTYRVRLTTCLLPAGISDYTDSVSYAESQPTEILFKTDITFSVNAPTVSAVTAEPSSTPEPSVTPSPVYGEDALYTVDVQFVSETGDGYQPLTLSLLADSGSGEEVVSTLTLSPDKDGNAHGQFSMAGLSTLSTYRATTTEYAGESLEFTYNEAYGAFAANAAGLLFLENTSTNSLSVEVSAISSITSVGLMSFGAEASTFSSSDPYTTSLNLQLNLSLNGAATVAVPIDFSIIEDAVTGAFSCTVNNFDNSIISVSSSVNGNDVQLSILSVIPVDDPTLRYTLVVNATTLAYTLTSSATGYESTLSGDTGTFTDGTASVDLRAMALTDFVFTVNWNDGKASTRPTPLFTLSADGVVIDPQPTLTQETLNYALEQYTSAGLHKYDSGNAILYSVTENAVNGYLTTVNGTAITNTVQTSLTVYMQWYDNSTSASTRPSSAECLTQLTLLQQARRTGSTAATLTLANDTLDATGNLWTFSVANLPAYDLDGYPYDYMILQGTIPSMDSSLGDYITTVKNVGIYAGQTAANTVYQGGTLINTIADSIGFSFTNIWKDAENVSGRPQIKYYLYRFPQNSGLSYDTLSPVKGHDNMTLADYSTVATVTYAANGTLPRYDISGNEYVYYLRETMANPGDYQVKITNASSSVANYILPGATVVNIREASISVPFTKIWKAKAVQSMTGGIAVQLERKLSTEDDSAWVVVGTKTLTGFRAETMTLSSAFGGESKYDSEGAAYQYRITEIGATINAIGGVVPTGNIIDGQFTDGDFTFSVTQPATGDSTNTIENALIGTTKLRVKKVWSPTLADGIAAAITIRILQNGSGSWDASGVTFPSSVTHVSDTLYTITGTGNLDVIFDHLPRYDSEGREYPYTVQETAIGEPSGYSLSNIYYSIDSDNLKNATIVNTSGGTGGMAFRINKVWLDDGDLLSRVPVTFGLYHLNGTDTPDLVATKTLTAADAWTGILSYTPASDSDKDYAQYYIREISNANLTVTMDTAYLSTGSGSAQSTVQKYQVSTTANSSNNTFTISNLRIGKVRITVSKQWHLNDLTALELYATFGLYQSGTLIDSQTLNMGGTGSIVFGSDAGLEKYDSNGVIIPYSVREISLTDKDGHSDLFSGGSISIKADEFILSSVTPGVYQFGSTLEYPDSMSYTFSNSLSGSNSVSINVIWRDTGTGVPIRPDIRLSLYRYTTVMTTSDELVATVRLWATDISDNRWYWTCGFGTYPKFDASGNRYHYYIKETMLQTSSYVASYFSDIDGVSTQPSSGGTTTATTFPHQAGERSDINYAYTNFDASLTGTIINTLSGTLDVERKKVWLNLPGWFKASNLPTVKFQLFRSLIPLDEITDSTVIEAVQKDGKDWVETLANGNTVADFIGAPVYNIYGDRYYYFVKELTASDIPFDVDWYTTSSNLVAGTITNNYKQNSPSVVIKINKAWDLTARSSEQTNYPATTYDLHQYWAAGSDSHDVVVQTATIPGGLIANLVTNPTPSVSVSTDTSGAALPRYAADGQEYTYYVVERTLSGYTITPASRRADITEWDSNHTVGEVAFTNTYTPANQVTISATKIWNDRNNQFLTRPAFNATAMPLSFTLKRKTASGVNEAVPVNLITDTAWTQGSGDASNSWFCTFTGTFPTTSTLGETYTYYVEESLSAEYQVSYTLTAGSGTLSLTNSLNQVNVLLTKSWKDSDDNTFTKEQLDHLKDLKAMPDSVTFTIHQSPDGGATWDRDLTPVTKVIDWSSLLTYALNGRYLVMAQLLPKYVPGTSTLYTYNVVETSVTYGSTTRTPSEAGFTIETSNPTATTTVIANKLQIRKLFFVKNWLDDHNRDGIRPTSIVFTVNDNTTSVSTTVTLSPTSTSTDPDTDSARIAAADRWRAELTVPVSGLYTVSEAAPGSGYTATAESPVIQKDSSNRNTWWGFTNERAIKLISVTGTKTWAGDSQWVLRTRPTNITYHLMYKKTTDTNWTDLTTLDESPDALRAIPFGAAAAITFGPGEGQTWADVTAQWNSLPAYAYKAVYTDTTVPLMYAVAETAVNGYTNAYAPTAISGDTALITSGANAIGVTNSLITISIAGTKHWVDASNVYHRRPSDLALTVYADGVAMSPQPVISWAKTGNDWTYSIPGLPRYRMGTLTPVLYTVVESAVTGYTPAGDTTVAGTVDTTTGNVTGADFTNTLITVAISGTKTWVDNSDKYGMRPSAITLTVKDGSTVINPQPTVNWVKSGNSWTYTLSGLPRYYAGTTESVVYSVEETAAGGYSPTTNNVVNGTVDASTGNVTGADFANTIITISLAGSKTWVDYSDLYAMRPTGITLSVKANGTALSPQPTLAWVKSGDVWTYSCSDIPKFAKGTYTPISYSVTETAVGGYTPNTSTTATGTVDSGTGNITTVDFTNTLSTISLSGSKMWSDQSNLYSRRPESISLTVLADGTAITPKNGIVWVKTANPWTFSITELPRYKKGTYNAIVYTVKETRVPAYSPITDTTASGTVNGTTGNITAVNFTNTLITVSVSGTKTWLDQSNRYGTRPSGITLTLLADGTTLSPQPTPTWNKAATATTWIYSYAQLPRYQVDNVTPIVYSVVETPVTGYTPTTTSTTAGTVNGTTGNVTAADFTNTLVTINITGSKTWNDTSDLYGMRPGSISLTVKADGTAMPTQPDIAWVKSGNTWTYTISSVPRYKANTTTDVVYSVTETAVGGYSPITDTTSSGIVNSTTGYVTAADFENTLITVSLAGSKTWVDYGNLYLERPSGITLTVLKNGSSLSPQPTLNWTKVGDVWTYTTSSLPRYVKGTYTAAVYSVTETAVGGYLPSTDTTVTGSSDTSGNVTGADFTNTLATITLSGAKTWVDQSNLYSRRPSGITISILADGIAITPKNGIEWSKTGDMWTYSVSELPRYREGTFTPIAYTVKETRVSGYSPITDTTVSGTVNGTTGMITNANLTNTLMTVSLSGTKTWVDTANRYHIRPSELSLTLLADGVPLSPQPTPTWNKTATASTWTYSYTLLPRYQADNVTPIVYSVVEQPSVGYSPLTAASATGLADASGNVTGADFTNTLITIGISGTKTWLDNSDHFGNRPAGIILVVKANGTAINAQPDILWNQTGDVWVYSITGLPRYIAGTTTDATYTVEETAVGGYLPASNTSVSGILDSDTRNITNADFTNTLATVSLSGSKTWVDASNYYGMRPTGITLTVKANGTALFTQPTLNWVKSGDVWTYTVNDLPKYIKGTYTPAVYTVSETAVGGYSPATDTTVNGTVDSTTGNITSADFTNTLATVSISGSKTWLDASNLYSRRPASITLAILADNVAMTPYSAMVWNTTSNPWTFSVSGLPRYQKGTYTAMTYAAEETAVAGYTPASNTKVYGTVNGTSGNITAANFTNTLVTVSVSGQKNWVDNNNLFNTRPAGITLTLLADGSALTPQPKPVWDKSSTANVWTYTYLNLPRYRIDNSTPIVYSVQETPVAGYSPLASVTAFGKADENGNVSAADFTNTLASISITGAKMWNDNGDFYAHRPESLNLVIKADGVALYPQPSLSWLKSTNKWTYTIVGLPRYQAGTAIPILYSVVETAVPDYVPTAVSVNGIVNPDSGDITAADFTNTLSTISITGTKYWGDASDVYSLRPTSLALTVYANGSAMTLQPDIQWTKNGNDWIYTINDLPRYTKGTTEAVIYQVHETPVPGYTPSATSAYGIVASNGNITNADFNNTMETISLSGSKLWVDQSNLYNTRPEGIALTVVADDTDLMPQPTVLWSKSGDTWSYSVANLPHYKLGTETPIVYAIRETAVAGYSPSSDTLAYGIVETDGNITAANFTNTLITVSVSGTKFWEDQDNRYAIRPDAIDLTPLADGIALSPKPTALWDKTTMPNAWSFVFNDLPRYRTGTNTPIIYSLHETEIDDYVPVADQRGSVDASTGNITDANFTNLLEYALEIDNTTVNAATGQTDAGGFVAINATPDKLRDIDPYQEHAVSTSWIAEDNWQVTDKFEVSYKPHGADASTGWVTVSVPYSDLTALQSIPYFTNATLSNAGGIYTLNLANSYVAMPCLTRVLVTYRPTIAAVNQTVNYSGGQVAVYNENPIKDGRYPALIAYADASSGYQVDLTNLQIILPNGEGSTSGKNKSPFSLIASAMADTGTGSNNVTLKPNSKGEFTTLINANIGGITSAVSITGTVKVLSLDSNANPSKVSISLDNLPTALNIGFRFVTSSAIPVTGDPIPWAIATFVFSGLMLIILRRKKGKPNHGSKTSQ